MGISKEALKKESSKRKQDATALPDDRAGACQFYNPYAYGSESKFWCKTARFCNVYAYAYAYGFVI